MASMRWLGQMLRPLRPGVDALTGAKVARRVKQRLHVTSDAFTEGDAIPAECSADGQGKFPGISWSGLPDGTKSVALLVEDADIPFVQTVTHLIVHSIPPEITQIEPGAVSKSMRTPSPHGWSTGRNFLGAAGWTPPAPPPGHGAHRYAFQVFALDAVPTFSHRPGRSSLMRRIRSHIIAQGTLIGTYKR